jgi:oxalate decarboxylase/phosphoglucose isomerase-like protein (cupin superfamily)
MVMLTLHGCLREPAGDQNQAHREKAEEMAMTDGMILPPGAGRAIQGAGMTLKVGAGQSTAWSAVEAVVTPGFDVGAHLHCNAEELFYILDGELDLLAFEPQARTGDDWRSWQSASGTRVTRGGPGSLMFVPAGCPHAFANRGTVPARMLFLVSPPGHEHYLDEIGKLTGQGGPPDPAAIAEIRARNDIQQLTPMTTAPPR